MSYSRRSRYSRSPSPRFSRSMSRSPSADVDNPGNNLYVTGLSLRTRKRDVEKHFSAEGEVVDVHLVTDPRTRESRGYGFVTMSRVEEADRCIKYLDRSVLEGRVITVEKARRRRGRTPTPGRYLGPVRRWTPSCSPYRRSLSRTPQPDRSRSRSRSRSGSRRRRRRSYSPYYRRRRSYSRDKTSCRRRSRSYSRSRSRTPYGRRDRSYSPYETRRYLPGDRYGRSYRYRGYSPDDRYYERRRHYRSVSRSSNDRYYERRRHHRSVSRSSSPRSASPSHGSWGRDSQRSYSRSRSRSWSLSTSAMSRSVSRSPTPSSRSRYASPSS